MDHLSGDLLFNNGTHVYLDDETLARTSCSVKTALHVISSVGPSLGLYCNTSTLQKCEVFGKEYLSAFPCEITKSSHTPHLEILGAPIHVGDEIFCSNFVAHTNASFLFHA